MAAAQSELANQLKTNGWGVDLTYQDAFGKWHETSSETLAAIAAALGTDVSTVTPPQDDSLLIVRAGEQRELAEPATICLETGEEISAEGRFPADLPPGYHTLYRESSVAPARLIVSPCECWLPEHLCTWGFAVQLYAARSRESWGIGDFADLDKLARWSAHELTAGMMMLNPLSAPSPVTPQQSSPYFPASRRFFNPLWIHVEWVPGASNLPQLEELARRGRELNRMRQIDRDQVFALKMHALEMLWLQFPGDDSFDAFCRREGASLDRFAIFCALAEEHNSGWHTWPEQYRHPDNPAVRRFAEEKQPRILFHKWLQWLLDSQLARCSEHLALMQDLPIGVDPDGADAWDWQDILATGAGVGAPPDEFNTQGQSWGLPPFAPHKLRAAGYEPFIQTIRAAFRYGGGLRIDHVMGLFRLFWIPQGMSAAQGTYVRYNADEMLALVALESQRARAFVVGEDLGTVEDEARAKLAQHRILSYRLVWFEKDAPEQFPKEALAAITTHDLPTVAGLWTGSDIEHQRKLKLKPNEESTAEIKSRLKRMAGVTDDSPIEEVITASYQLLSRAPSRIVTAALEDAAAVKERPNLPATTSDQNPNWSLALPVPIEELMQSELPRSIAAELKR